jgi:hypothetical protein
MDGAAVMHEDILAKICADTRAEVACRKQRMSLEEIKLHARDAEKPRGFGRALMDATAAGRPGLITEIKNAGPRLSRRRRGLPLGPHRWAVFSRQERAFAGSACRREIADHPQGFHPRPLASL